MKKTIVYGLLNLFLLGMVFADPKAKVTAKVYDQEQRPLENVNMMVVYHQSIPLKLESQDVAVEGVSDTNGLFAAEGEGDPRIFVIARKKGYYKSSEKLQFRERNKVLNRWTPWNPTVELMLKKKRDPVPMFHYFPQNYYEIRTYEKAVGYDMEIADWTAPYGKGKFADMTLHIKRRFVSPKDYNVIATLTFPNEGDGIQEYYFDENDKSEFKWPYTARTNGYNSTLVIEESRSTEGYKSTFFTTQKPSPEKRNINYLFRVRTILDEKGNIVSAHYGKIEGEIVIGWGELFNWKYWFNPDSTSRSLEEDPMKTIILKPSRRSTKFKYW